MRRLFSTYYWGTLLFLLTIFNITCYGQKSIILDTDFGGDADDLGALAMLNHFQNRNEIKLLAVMCWNTEKYAVSAIDAVNTYYGNPDVPIGTRSAEAQITEWNHTRILADNLPHDASRKSVPETTGLYRQILNDAKDQSITIITIGPLLNIKSLLLSKPDDISPLSGPELIESKVKEFVIMGGEFPNSDRREWNFDGNMKGITQFVLANLKVPITFLGYEVGVDIKTGEVFNELDVNAPLYLGYFHFSKYCPWLNSNFKGRIYNNSTYDQTAVLYAVRGGIGDYWHRIENGVCLPDPEGRTSWEASDSSLHSYLVLDWSRTEMAQEIEKFMLGNF